MKRNLLWMLLFLPACTTTKSVIAYNEPDPVLNSYSKPFKVFGIGYWNKDCIILTLTDANNQYVTVKAHPDSSLRIGNIYKP